MKPKNILLMLFAFSFACSSSWAVPGMGPAIRETSEFILKKFGKGAAGQTADEVAKATAKIVAQHGDAALPLLRNSGHAGFTALRQAGDKAIDVIKLHARKGNEAIWIVSRPKKLSIFLKHGDSAADALIKHPGIADNLIGKYGDDAVGAINKVTRPNAQRLGVISKEGLLEASKRSPELLPVIRRYGDEAMEFIWKNKGSLTVASVLATFLADPDAYISGAKELVKPITESMNWTWIAGVALVVVFLPFIARSISKARAEIKSDEVSESEADEKEESPPRD